MTGGVLFVHNNFPAQFRDIAQALVARGTPCAAIGSGAAPGMEGVRIERFQLAQGSTPNLFGLAIRAEADLLRGYAAYEAATRLKAQGFEPDLIVGHPGWGEMVLLSEVFPGVRQIHFAEFFYHGRGADIDFDTEFVTPGLAGILAGKTKNAVSALSLSDAEVIVAPTAFQASLLPPVFRRETLIIHEGVDVERACPGPALPLPLPDGRVLGPETPLITHVNRSLEPLRGLHILLRALPQVQAQAPDAHVLIVGDEWARGYSGAAPEGSTWKREAMKGLEGKLDMSRIHFVGRLPHEAMLAALRRSRAHVYYTYPFVLSWSLAEAMACGCYVIASDTAPVRDAIIDGVNGKLLDFFDVDALATALVDACRAPPDAFAALRAAARETAVARFDRREGRRRWMELIDGQRGRKPKA